MVCLNSFGLGGKPYKSRAKMPENGRKIREPGSKHVLFGSDLRGINTYERKSLTALHIGTGGEPQIPKVRIKNLA